MDKTQDSNSERDLATDSDPEIMDENSSVQGGDNEETVEEVETSLLNSSTEVIKHTISKKKSQSPGIVYLSRIPPYMCINKVRHLLSQFGVVTRIFLQPEDKMTRRRRRKQGGKKKKRFEEGWVEFRNKKVAKGVAACLNSTPIGGKKGNFHYFDLWTVKYLHGFKWFHLTESIAYQNAVREQRLRTEISQVKRENQFYLQNVEKGKEIGAIQERKIRQNKKVDVGPERIHPQNQVLAEADKTTDESMSVDFLAKIFPNSIND